MEVDGILAAARELKRPLTELRQLAFCFDGAGEFDEVVREEMISISERAIRQANDLMKLKKLEVGLFEMEPVAVRAVCDEVVMELRQLFGKQNANVKVRYKNREPVAWGNRELLKSIVWNFLLDARKYDNAEYHSTITVKGVHDRLLIGVRDYGPKLPESVWREMKSGLEIHPESIAMRPGTSVLSLFIASKFSKYMNAKIGAVRHRDGTSFYVSLPISRQGSLF